MKIYTRTGDDGTTSLIGGERVAKTDIRIEAYGTIDELMAHTALLRDLLASASDSPAPEGGCKISPARAGELLTILDHLMRVSSFLALSTEAVVKSMPSFSSEEVAWLEERIDALQEGLPQIKSFTLPGGDPLISLCHICRTVARRAERAALRAAEEYPLDSDVMRYINRLSDYFYVLGRSVATELNVKELLWDGGK